MNNLKPRLVVEALARLGGLHTTEEIRSTLLEDWPELEQPPSFIDRSINEALDLGYIVKIQGHRHVYLQNSLIELVNRHRTGAVCQCKDGPVGSNRPDLYRTTVYTLSPGEVIARKRWNV